MLTEIRRLRATNQDIDNTPPSSKQNCEDIVNISLFFDGTGNNFNNDEKIARLSNPARLWKNAVYYSTEEANKNSLLTKLSHPIYVSGVGTPFNGDLNGWVEKRIAGSQDHFPTGGATGVGGARRLEYGEEQLNKNLENILKQKILQLENKLQSEVTDTKAQTLQRIESNLSQHRLIKKINLSIFGFSRGAALARAFSNEIIWKSESEDSSLQYQIRGYPYKIPLDINFLGIFDTVASFGLPATNLPNKISFKGRDLVIDQRIQNCLHLVAGNEQRFSFPVDSIRKDGVLKNPNWKEIVYPGMHSDVGGGYGPNSQNVNNNFAKIPLKHMINEAESVGIKVFNYNQLKEQFPALFEDEFQIQEETQQLFDAVQTRVGEHSGSIEDDVKKYMQIYYSAYGTLYRQRQKYLEQGNIAKAEQLRSVSQRIRDESRAGFLGPADMATEIENFKNAKKYTSFKDSEVRGFKHLLRIFYPLFKLYEFYVDVDDWELESWERDVDQNVIDFYLTLIHDSKYGFVSNIEPFSYFRQRTIYESTRSTKGKGVDRQLQKNIETEILNQANKNVDQNYLFDSVEQSDLNKDQSLSA